MTSETSEYILGQVRAMALIVADAKLHARSNPALTYSLLEQIAQEIEFLQSMLIKHPPYRPSSR